MIAIIDYGMGNLHSVLKALQRLGAQAVVTSDHDVISRADKLILPGVGHFANAMARLESLRLVKLLNDRVIGNHTPILGICLGMQLFTKHSEEGNTNGLGWIDATTHKFEASAIGRTLKVPHMGWNSVRFRKSSKLTASVGTDPLFYFVHSYFVRCQNPADSLGTTEYGVEFDSAFELGHIAGMQFHPEKSHTTGLTMISNFLGRS